MLKAFVFYGSLAIAGAVFTVLGGINLTGEIIGPGAVVLSFGGLGLVLYSVYMLVSGDPAESVPGNRWVAATTVSAAVLALWAVTGSVF